MKLSSFVGFVALLGAVLLPSSVLASQINYVGAAQAGDGAQDTAAGTADSVGTLSYVETATSNDIEGSIIGLGESRGAAEIGPGAPGSNIEELRFAQTSLLFGGGLVTSTTVMETEILSPLNTSATGIFSSTITPGGLFMQTEDTTVLSAFDVTASFSLTVSISDGLGGFDEVVSMGAELLSDGSAATTENLGLLDGVAESNSAVLRSITWEETLFELDLGTFDPGVSRTLRYTVENVVQTNTACAANTSCPLAASAFGDPTGGGGGYGSIMTAMFYIVGEPVPEPSTLGVLLLGSAGLLLRGRRKRAS